MLVIYPAVDTLLDSVGVKFTQHGTCLSFIIPPPPKKNLVLSFLFKIEMIVYVVAASKNMIFIIQAS